MNLKETDSKRNINRLLFAIGLLLFIYVVVRACILSITIDEAYSYLFFVQKGANHFDLASANNHLLNSFLVKYCVRIFGLSELSIRLPNVLAHILFLVYSAKLFNKFSSKTLTIFAFLIINLNPFVLDFFSLSRGYGLSLGLMMGSIYFGYRFIHQKRNYTFALISVLFGCVALFANFTLLIYFLSTTSIYLFINFLRWRDDKPKSILSLLTQTLIIASPLISMIFIGQRITNMNNAGALWWGGDSGFWQDTVFSLITLMTYGNPFMHFLRNGIQIGVALVLITSVVMIFIHLRKNKPSWKSFYLLFIATIILLCFLANFAQGLILGIVYLTERTAIFYYPLFIILMVFLFDLLIQRKKKLFTGIFIGFSMVFILNFILSINFHYVIQWKQQADVKDMLTYLAENNTDPIGEKTPKQVSVMLPRIPWIFDHDIRFYKLMNHWDWIKVQWTEDYENLETDYFFIEKIEMHNLKEHSIDYKIIKEYPTSEMLLVEVKKP